MIGSKYTEIINLSSWPT